MPIKKYSADKETMASRGVLTWPIWECEPSTFDWHYDQEESCYILAGEVTVKTTTGEEIEIGPGDFVTFPQGLDCVWTVRKAVRKHYQFS